MLDRFTNRAGEILLVAQDEARALNHPFLGTEHLLAAMAADEGSVTAHLFSDLGVEADAIRNMVREIVGEGWEKPSGHIPFTPRAKRALIEAARVADPSAHKAPVTVIHVLLGVLSVGDSVAAQVLQKLGVSVSDVGTAALYELGRLGIPIASPNPEPVVLRVSLRKDLPDDDLAKIAEGLRESINTLRRLQYQVRKEQVHRQQEA